MKIKIYCIIDINNLKYVGSTNNTLHLRLLNHKSSKKLNKKSCSVSSKLLDLDNCEIILLCECDECDRNKMEQYFIDNINCVNKNNTILNKEKKKEYRKSYEKSVKRSKYKKSYDSEYGLFKQKRVCNGSYDFIKMLEQY